MLFWGWGMATSTDLRLSQEDGSFIHSLLSLSLPFSLSRCLSVSISLSFSLSFLQWNQGVCCPPLRTSSHTSWAWAGSTPTNGRTLRPSSWQRGAAPSRIKWGALPPTWPRATPLSEVITTIRKWRKTSGRTCKGNRSNQHLLCFIFVYKNIFWKGL